MTRKSGTGECIIEFLPNGNFVKVSAFDPVTLTEVSIVGSAKASKAELQSIAVKKLHYVLNKKKQAASQASGPAPKGRGGIIV